MSYPTSRFQAFIYYPSSVPYSTWFGNSIINLAGDYGFRLVNPHEQLHIVKEHLNPLGRNATIRGNFGQRTSADMTMMTMLYGDDQGEVFDKIAAVTRAISSAQNYASLGRTPYLRMGVWNGASLDYYRKYGLPYVFSAPMAPGTIHQATAPGVSIGMRCGDPSWYIDTQEIETTTIVGGTGTTGLFAGAGEGTTYRCVVKILKNGVDNPTNVTVANTGSGNLWSFGIAGSLTGLNDYWLIDTVTGLVQHYDDSTGNWSDAISSFTGSYPWITGGGFNKIDVTDTAASDFQVKTHYVGRIT